MLTFGNTPVPFTVSWSNEQRFFIADCRFACGRPAMCNDAAAGEGKPVFGKPHMQRQRQAVHDELCDLCGKPLKGRTKVSLSHASVRAGADGPCVMQVEPMSHKECAATALRLCPSLKRDIRQGTLFVRQVSRWRPQYALLTELATEEFMGERHAGVVGHAKIELLAWRDRSLGWLE